MMAELQWSIFGSHAANRIMRSHGEWSALVDLLKRSGPHPNKASCPWIKLASFGDVRAAGGSLRNNANVQVIYGLEGDYDAGLVSLEDALAMLESAGIRAAVYTSPSHTPQFPRWRVLAPLNNPALPEQRESLLARLNGALNGILAPESFTLSQSYYYGQVDGAPEYRVLVTFDDPQDGTCVDDLHELDAIAIGRRSIRPVDTAQMVIETADPAEVFGQRVMQLGRRLKTGDGRREMLKSYVASRSARGIRGADLMTLVSGICASYFDPADPIDDGDIADIAAWASARDARSAEEAGRMVAGLMPKAIPVDRVKQADAQPRALAPSNLLTPPGILGAVTEWVNATSRKPQPAFAVQTAIAFCATVLGRRFVTEHRNWPSLYLLNIGHSASGKEYAKKAVEDLLDACDLTHLIGPASYTSASGVMSALHDQPSHITIIDEFGKEIEQASIKNNERAKGTQRILMEVWGRCDGTVRPQGYSTVGMSEKDLARLKERNVRNPALTLMAMTTPDSFFGSIGSAAARDGFLNRFITVESDIGPQVSQFLPSVAVPQSIREWAQAMHLASAGLVDPSSGAASLAPVPVEVQFSKEATELFKNYEADCVRRAVTLRESGLMEMVGRNCETAMRLALIVACGHHHGAPGAISGPDMAWAINYVRFHSDRAIDNLANCVSDSEFEAAKMQVLNLIRKAGSLGMTEREIEKGSRKFRAVPQRQQVELLNSLQFVGHVQRVEIPPTSGRGQSRKAWVALADDADIPGTGSVPA